MTQMGAIPPVARIAIGTPIFSPYLEIPVLAEFGLDIVDIRMDSHADWQFPAAELAKLDDPAVKIFCLVNPSNPPSTKMSDATLVQLADFVANTRPDLFIVTDDVYGTFADDFVSIFAKCARNTLCVYSFSKFFGATGWRLGVIALHDDNVFDAALAHNPRHRKSALIHATPRSPPNRAIFASSIVWSPTAEQSRSIIPPACPAHSNCKWPCSP